MVLTQRSLFRREGWHGWHEGSRLEGTGFVGWAEQVPPPQTGLWAFPPAKSSKTFLAPFLTSFLVLFSPLPSPRLYANHKILEDSG